MTKQGIYLFLGGVILILGTLLVAGGDYVFGFAAPIPKHTAFGLLILGIGTGWIWRSIADDAAVHP